MPSDLAKLTPLLLAVASCKAGVIRVADLPAYHFGAPALVKELASTSKVENPTLTADSLQIFFTTNRNSGTSSDVWFARRSSVTEPFGAPEVVPGVNSDDRETSAAISADGLTLWLGSERPGGLGNVDIWAAERTSTSGAWSAPVNLVALNSSADDIPRPPGQHGLVMPMASTSASPDQYWTYLATRADAASPFEKPVPIRELQYSDRSSVDASLSDDGLTMFFSSSPRASAGDDAATADSGAGGTMSTAADLYVAFRSSTREPFSVPQALDDLNTAFDERDPFLSADGSTLYFTSDRDGTLGIYTASVSR